MLPWGFENLALGSPQKTGVHGWCTAKLCTLLSLHACETMPGKYAQPCRRGIASSVEACTHTSGASAGVVDVCLIPEVPFALKGPKGLFAYVEKVLEERGHCVMCIAEGAGQVSRTASNTGLLSNLSVVFHCALAAVLQPPEA